MPTSTTTMSMPPWCPWHMLVPIAEVLDPPDLEVLVRDGVVGNTHRVGLAEPDADRRWCVLILSR